MTIEDTAKIMKLLVAAYESFYRKSDKVITQDRVRLWHDMFADDDVSEVAMAVKAYIATDTSGYPPDVGKIKEYICKLHNSDELTEQEAWNLVYKAACNSAYHAREEYEKLPLIIQRLLGSASYLRDISRMESDTLTVTASNFMRSYKARAENERKHSKMPTDVKVFIGQLANAKSLDSLERANPKAIPTQDNTPAPMIDTVEQERIQARLDSNVQRTMLDLRQAKERLKQLEQEDPSGELTDWTEKKRKAQEMLKNLKS